MIASRYELLEEIGAGGEARVFRARDTILGDEIALRLAKNLKIIPSPESPSLQNPGWVRMLTSGIDAEHGPFQVFELLSGETLGALVSRGPLSPGDWSEFVRESLDALEALHATGWVHGDVNADNFMRTSAGWKLLELPFHRLDSQESRSPLFGSIYTLAPEQLGGRMPDVGSDLYALGCLYYFSASATYPNAGGGPQNIAVDRLRFDAAPLADKARALDKRETDFVMKLLARDPRDRPASVAAARQLLSIAHRPPAPGY